MNQLTVQIHIDVLGWWLNSGLEIKYDCEAMNCASMCGDIDTLNWWFDSGLELRYDDSINDASIYGHIHILN